MSHKSVTILIIASALIISSCNNDVKTGAEKLFINAVIYSADSDQTVHTAMGISGDHLVFLGDVNDATDFIDNQTEIMDLQGKMIIPGLHDVHIHLPGIVKTNNCDLDSQAFSLADLVPRLKQCMNRLNPMEGEWLTVEQWGYSQGNEPSEAFPTIRSALDAVSLKHPIVLLGDDGHHGAVNSAALSLATDKEGKVVGLNKETINDEFSGMRALIGVDSFGEPNGVLNEDARKIVNLPNLWGYPEVDLPVYLKIADRLAASGITSTMDAAMRIEDIDSFAKWAKIHPLTYRLTAAFYPEFEDYRLSYDEPINIKRLLADLKKTQSRHIDVPNLKIDTAKIFVDGVIEGDPHSVPPMLPNAALLNNYLQPIFAINESTQLPEVIDYVDTSSEICRTVRERGVESVTPFFEQTFFEQQGFLASQCLQSNGVLEKEYEFIFNYTLALFDAGINVHSHAIGDRAVRIALDTFEAAKNFSPESSAKLSIAHAQIIHPDDIVRIGALDVGIAFTYSWIEPFSEYQMMVSPFIEPIFSEDDLYDTAGYVYKNSYPAASVKEAGGLLVSGSDAPVESRDPRPMLNIEKAVTRKNEVTGRIYNSDEQLSIKDVIDAYTINGALMLNQSDFTGSLEVGKKADFVILNQDLLSLVDQGHSDKISDTQILATWFNGIEIYGESSLFLAQ
jgi:predicted amidohydrolase YtcJ